MILFKAAKRCVGCAALTEVAGHVFQRQSELSTILMSNEIFFINIWLPRING